MFIKICGATNEEDALLAVAMGADAVGFVFAASPRKISLDRARDIARRLPSDILTVGVFRNELPTRVVQIVSRTSLRAAQLHGSETAEDTAWVAERVPTTIKAFPAGHDGLGRLGDYHADIVLIDSVQPGSGRMFDWSLTENAPISGHRLMLAGGLGPENVVSAIHAVKPWGVDVSTGVERSPGRKDPAKMRAFIERAKATRPEGSSPARPPLEDIGRSAPYDWETGL